MLKLRSLDELQEQYVQSDSRDQREKIVAEVHRRYIPLMRKRASNLYNMFPHTPYEDFCQIIRIGIWQGLNRRKIGETTAVSIFRRVRFEISKEIQKYFAQKNPVLHESLVSFYDSSGECGSTDTIIRNITRMDIEDAISQLPEVERNTILLWYKGYNANEIGRYHNISRSYVYKSIDSAKRYLCSSLKEYGSYASA